MANKKKKEVGFHKIRHNIHKPTKAHKVKTKYTRKIKHKKGLIERLDLFIGE